MIFLIDYNLQGHSLILFGAIASQGWLDLVPIQFVTFTQIELPTDNNDRVVWRLAQENQMILITANRSMKGKDSLEQVIREENTVTSLPVITIGNPDRILNDLEYREKCVERLIEIVLDLDEYRGLRRIFIP
ncbi:MAG: ACP S-malonyltransferase [Oscillatoria sp. PMC 1051.18]|nr:ACP S-malonyltransferase [Oscillatoria sp. PMC 1050.18]MEC5032288.1 ACP S-malonyltransferase [Oscillatoria sp. PMC 1051.18]